MWIIAEYQPTSFFSLRPYTATTSGGKSLIVPTPFAIKMALLDVAIRTQGLEQGKTAFSAIRDLQIGIRLPSQIVVNNTFTKILRLKEIKSKATEKEQVVYKAIDEHQWPFQRTIAFREYVQFAGPLALAFQGMTKEDLAQLLTQLNYLGKRGGFLQLLSEPHSVDELGPDFTMITQGPGESFVLGMMQMLDDCGPSLTFDRANVYDPSKRIRANQDRVFHHVVLPYRLARSSKNYCLYERIGS